MALLNLIASILKSFVFIAGIFTEKDAEKAEKKAELGKGVIDAFKQTDKKKRARDINSVINDINRL